jgi:hypothetical protein
VREFAEAFGKAVADESSHGSVVEIQVLQGGVGGHAREVRQLQNELQKNRDGVQPDLGCKLQFASDEIDDVTSVIKVFHLV